MLLKAKGICFSVLDSKHVFNLKIWNMISKYENWTGDLCNKYEEFPSLYQLSQRLHHQGLFSLSVGVTHNLSRISVLIPNKNLFWFLRIGNSLHRFVAFYLRSSMEILSKAVKNNLLSPTSTKPILNFVSLLRLTTKLQKHNSFSILCWNQKLVL